MDKLTREEVERCARARGWGDELPLKNGMVVLDSYFWFGQLWDKLFNMKGQPQWTELMVQRPTGIIIFGAGTKEEIGDQHPCLALCGAIEKIQNSHGSDTNRR